LLAAGCSSPTGTTGAAPEAELSFAPSNPGTGDTVFFDASGSTDDGTIEEYQWDFDGDDSADTTKDVATATHSYRASGSVTASVTVKDNDGNSGTASVVIQVTGNTFPIASLTHSPNQPSIGQTVTLDASESRDPDGSVQLYEYDYDGDGVVDVSSQFSTADFSYSSSGTVTAVVTATDDDGDQDQDITTIEVQ